MAQTSGGSCTNLECELACKPVPGKWCSSCNSKLSSETVSTRSCELTAQESLSVGVGLEYGVLKELQQGRSPVSTKSGDVDDNPSVIEDEIYFDAIDGPLPSVNKNPSDEKNHSDADVNGGGGGIESGVDGGIERSGGDGNSGVNIGDDSSRGGGGDVSGGGGGIESSGGDGNSGVNTGSIGGGGDVSGGGGGIESSGGDDSNRGGGGDVSGGGGGIESSVDGGIESSGGDGNCGVNIGDDSSRGGVGDVSGGDSNKADGDGGDISDLSSGSACSPAGHESGYRSKSVSVHIIWSCTSHVKCANTYANPSILNYLCYYNCLLLFYLQLPLKATLSFPDCFVYSK